MKHILQTFMAAVLLGPVAALLAAEASAPTLPSVESVLERLVEQSQKEAANARAFKQRYQFTRSRATEVRNSKGEVNKRELKTEVNQPGSNPEPADAAVENQPGRASRPGRKMDFAVNRELLQRYQFTLAGREPVNGRPALILDLGPAAQKPPEHDLKDRLLNKMAGRVWVDETEAVLVKADFHLTERVNVVAGLVGAIASFNLSFQRTRTAEGLWFTPELNWQLEAREVFVRRTVNAHEEITGVQLSPPYAALPH